MMKYIKKLTIFTFAMLMVAISILSIGSDEVEAYSPPPTITGTARTVLTKSYAWGNGKPFEPEFNVTMPDGQVIVGFCIDHGKYAPVDSSYPFTATYNASGGYYDVIVHSNYPHNNNVNSIHPSERGAWGAGIGADTQRVGRLIWKPKGSAKLKKAPASNTHLINHAPEHYSLAGTQYTVYQDANLNNVVSRFDIDANGDSNTLTLPATRYYLKETAAGKGYKLDPNTYILDVKPNETTVLNVTDEPAFDPLTLMIEKKAEDGTDKNLSVEGAEYSIDYYKELEVTEENIDNYTPYRHWVFRTDKDGHISATERYKVGGDELFKNDKGIPVGLIGTYAVRELLAPLGFAKTEGIISLQKVTETNRGFGVSTTKNVLDIEKPQTISITINKVDKETKKAEAQGYGTLAGARYDVKLWNTLTNTFTKVAELVTDVSGKAIYTGGKPGLYEVVETEASNGYILDKVVKKVEAGIKAVNIANFNYDVTSPEEVTEVVIKKTTIDKDGNIINLAGAVIELLDDSNNVIEKFTTSDTPYTIKGLAKDRVYRFREKTAPNGYFKNEEVFSVTLTEENGGKAEVEIFNEPVPSIKTTATFDNGAKVAPAEKRVTVKDKVMYYDLIPGKEYVAKAKLVMDDDESNIVATGEKNFTPTSPNGYVYVDLTFDASMLEDKSVVVFEDLYKNGKKLASHSDITDKKQTVHFSKIGTKASYIDGTKEKVVSSKMELKDVMSYSNLKITKGKVVGILMDKNTKKPYIDADGKEVKAEAYFDILDGSGEIEILFSFNGLNIDENTDLVVFETVYDEEGRIIAKEHNFENKDQTVKALPLPPGRIIIHRPPRVNTGDDNNLGLLYSALCVGAVGSVGFRRRKEDK